MAEKTFLPVFAVLSLLVFICPLHSGVLETDTLERDYEPVVVEGGMMPGISGGQIPLEQIYAYAYRENQWRQVVLQIDERNEDDDYFKIDEQYMLLDDNDELVFMSFELGDRVDRETWLAGSDSSGRYEVEVVDGADPGKKGWLYFFLADGIERVTTDYVDWSGMADQVISTEVYTHNLYDDMVHVYNDVEIEPGGGGDGEDIMDRTKVRNKLFFFSDPTTEEDLSIDWKHVTPIDGQVRHIATYWTGLFGVVDGSRVTMKNYLAYNVMETYVYKQIIPLEIYSLKQYFDFAPTISGMIHYDDGGADPEYNKDTIDGLGGGNPNVKEPCMTWFEVDHATAGSWLVFNDLSDMSCQKINRYYNDGGYVGGGDTGDGWQWGESGYEGRKVGNSQAYTIMSFTYNLPARIEPEGPYGPEYENDFFYPMEITTALQTWTVGIENENPPVSDTGSEGAGLCCRPNPFNPVTNINFKISGENPAPVTIRIFDITGRTVAVLLDGETRSPGLHSITWTGKNSSGKPLVSGVYVATIYLPDDTATSKLVLCR